MSSPRTEAAPEMNRSSAKKMFSVPSVTMKGGRRSRVMRRPLSGPHATRGRSRGRARAGLVRPTSAESLGHDDRGEDHDGADREVDARGQDDDGLPDRQRPHDHHLLDDQRHVGRHQEPGRQEREDGQHQQEDAERTERGVGMQQVLQPVWSSALGSSRWISPTYVRGRLQPRWAAIPQAMRSSCLLHQVTGDRADDTERGGLSATPLDECGDRRAISPSSSPDPRWCPWSRTPATGWSVMSTTPVLVKLRPGSGDGGAVWCSRTRRSRRRHPAPSAAGTASRWRR